MALKKSDLYSSIWSSCDALRGGMDPSQYKDYVLFMLFIKYVSDKYGDSDAFVAPVVIPKGAHFRDMIALKGKPDIGDRINTQVIQPLIDANTRLARSDFPDFNDSNKLGEGQDKVDRLTNLVGIFQKPELDFSANRADHDDILGDAYEYLMRHFAQDSGKSKGQFYTPSEVSRVIAKVLGIGPHNTRAATSVYDPTCGSGSLLLKVAAEAGKHITLEGQEKDVTTAGLARMNMILHDFPTANILTGNTLATPKFRDGDQLRTYDYVVANPPFSKNAVAEGIINNVRKTIIRDQLTDPKFYSEISTLLEDLIAQKRQGTVTYEEFLKRAESLVQRMAKKTGGTHPLSLHGRPEAIVIFNNLSDILDKDSVMEDTQADIEKRAVLALQIDRAVREHAPTGWKEDAEGPKGKQVLKAIYALLDFDQAATLALFEIIKKQQGY